MFKPLILATIGVSAMASVAAADTIIVQSGPTHPANSVIAYDGPSFTRMVEMCARMGLDCSAPEHVAQADVELEALPLPHFSAEWEADAAKRRALLLADYEAGGIGNGITLTDALNPTQRFGWGSSPFLLDWSLGHLGNPTLTPRHGDVEVINQHAFLAPQVQSIWDNAFRGLQRPAYPHGLRPYAFTHAYPRTYPYVLPNTLPRGVPHINPRILPHALPRGGLIPWPSL